MFVFIPSLTAPPVETHLWCSVGRGEPIKMLTDSSYGEDDITPEL